MKKLSDSIQALDDQYSHRPTLELHKQRLNLQAEFNLLTTGEAERLLLCARGNYYEYGDKVGRLLAHQLRNRAASRFVTQIAQPDGALSSDPVEINSTFKNFFSFLYKTEASGHSEEMNQFLGRINFPRVDPLLVPELDGPITLEEITKSINSLQSKKSPCPDGLPYEFYKKVHVKLAPLLLSVFEESLDLGMLPLTLRQASITILPKDGKDPTLCNSYRPISLLNVDVKILAKILAFRLEVVLPSIISEEQTGFIKGRYSFSNICTLFYILFSRQNSVSSEVVISLDAEKAFDRIEWVNLFRVLKEFGFGEGLISWIRLLYVDPQASVSTNSVNSEYFTLSRGTRQGCPLSPLLFAIAIEPLSIMLRTLPVFQGIIRKGIEHKLALYADDLLLYVTVPIASIPEIIHLLDDFGKFSGYKLNLQKSECLPINQSGQKLKQNDIPFHLESSKFKYLGVNVTLSYSALKAANFAPLVSYMEEPPILKKLTSLSPLGRINAVKMNILPKFLYLFQAIPLFLPKSFFKNIDKRISSFIWAGKTPRISKISLPYFMYYYWAANIQKLVFWVQDSSLPWCNLEAKSCVSSSLPAMVFSSLPMSLSHYTDNPIVCSSLKTFFQFRRHFKFTSASTMAPIHKNHLFLPPFSDSVFALWEKKGLKCFEDLFINNVFASFSELSLSFNLPSSHLFRYFQIRHCASSLFSGFPSLPTKSPWEEAFKLNLHMGGIISKIYAIILSKDNYHNIKIIKAWEEELDLEFEDDYWSRVLDKIRTTTSCARFSFIQFKTIHRAHLSKAKLSKIYPNVSDVCD